MTEGDTRKPSSDTRRVLQGCPQSNEVKGSNPYYYVGIPLHIEFVSEHCADSAFYVVIQNSHRTEIIFSPFPVEDILVLVH